MVYMDDSQVMIDGVLLPGLYKSLEVTTAAEVEEQEVEGSTSKPKQATGYEDGKISIELLLIDEEGLAKEEKLRVIQNFFRQTGQDVPAVHTISNPHTAIRNITKVLFKNLVTKETNAKDQITATLEFWEYVPMTISITAARTATENKDAGGGQESGITDAYRDYLNNRGAAPKQSDKTAKSPAVDNRRAMTQ